MVLVLLLLLLSVPVYGQFLQEPPSELDELQQAVPVALADESDEPDSGNWYEKLKWWKEAKWTYTVDVVSAMEHLTSIEKAYEQRRDDMLTKIGDYSELLPVKRDEAEKEIDDLIEDMVRRQNEIAKEEPNKRDESQSDELEQQKKMLTELKEKFSQFNTLAKRVKQVFDEIVPQQLADAKEYEQEALQAYQGIEKILDDKKAEQFFNEVENSLDNIKAITNYLKGPLNAFLDRAWAKSQEIMPQITSSIQQLEAEGVVVRPLSAEEKEQMTAIEKQRLELKAKRAAEAEAAKKRAALPWYQKFFSAIGSFLSTLWSGITTPFVWLGNLFAGTSEPVKKSEPVKPVSEAPPKEIVEEIAEKKEIVEEALPTETTPPTDKK